MNHNKSKLQNGNQSFVDICFGEFIQSWPVAEIACLESRNEDNIYTYTYIYAQIDVI